MPGMGAIMEQRRLPAAEQVQVAERVTFQDRRRTVAGHVARKGRTYAYIVTDDGIEMRVPYRLLSRVPGTPRKHVQSRTDTMRARFHAGDRVRFAVGTAVLHGTISRVNPNSVRLNFCMAVALSDASGQYGRSIQLPWPSH